MQAQLSKTTTIINRTFSAQGKKDNGIVINGQSSTMSASQSSDILESAAATTQWKRSQYQNIQDKFNKTNIGDTPTNESSTQQTTNQKQQEPLNITNYDDVQPMWKEMESRVTKRRSLTLQQRGGVSGRRNVRKSDEDVWLEAGVYNNNSDDNNSDDNDVGDKDDDDVGCEKR